mgnify:CR=1 FL=1
MPYALDKKEQKLINLAKKGGRDAELYLLDEIQAVDEKLEAHTEEMSEAFEQLEIKFDNTVKEIKEGMPDFNKFLENVRGTQGEKGEQGESGKDGEDGENGQDGKNGISPNKNEIIREVVSLIPTPKDGRDGKDGKDGSPDTSEDIKTKLESLEGNKRLDKKAVKGLDESIEEVKEELRKTKDVLSNRGMGMRKIPIIKRMNLTSLTDGSTRNFTLPRDTVDVVGVWGSDFPQNYNPLTDWTFAGNTLTLSSGFEAPRTGTTLFAIIETLFYGAV